MAWDFSTAAEFEAELAWMREFVREEVMPLETLDLDDERLRQVMRPLQQVVKTRGLWAPRFDQVRLCLMHEVIGECSLATEVFGMSEPDAGNAELLEVGIDDSGREEQREKWLLPLRDGEIRSAFAMTEPGAGSDPTLFVTTAARDGDEWVINGEKSFVSNGALADIFLVMAVTNPDVHPYQGASMFVVPADTPGLRRVRDVATMDRPTSEIVLTDVRVPHEHLVGNEGEAFVLAQKRLGPSRLHATMRWLGQARRAFDMLCERAVSRYTHGSVLADKQAVQHWVADSMAEMTAARLMTLNAAWKVDAHGASAARVEIAMAKYFGAGVLYDVIDRAMQAHGALGLSTDLPLEQMYRAARAARVNDGPDEVHKVTVARKVLEDYKPVEVPTEHVPTRREVAKEKFAAILDAASV